ncbi:MAG: Crp/Fnr family transcriptional regulator [Anaerolineae bacterium]
MSLLIAGIEQAEKDLIDDIRQIGFVELKQTQAGRELLEILNTEQDYARGLGMFTQEGAIHLPLESLRALQAATSLSDRQIELLISKARRRIFEPDETIFREGDTGSDLYIIEDGQVFVYKGGEATSMFEVKIFVTGEFLGEMALLDAEPRSASARAIVRTKVLIIDRQWFFEAVKIEPTISIGFMRALSLRTRDFTAYTEQLASRYSESERIALRLLGLAAQTGSFDGKTMRMNLDLAKNVLMLGTKSETVTQVLSRMQAQGLINIKPPDLIVPDYPNLFQTLVAQFQS